LTSLYHRRYEDEAKKLEQRSLAFMHLLLRRCREVLAFLSILHEHRFVGVFRSLPGDLQERINRIRFSELVSTSEGFELTRSLVNALVGLYAEGKGDQASVDAICKTLRDRCPVIFREEDRIRHKAEELLYKANTSRISRERQELLDKSLKLFLRIPADIVRDLGGICESYQFLGFFMGVVQLALACAEAEDPLGHAVEFYQKGLPAPDDDPIGFHAFEARRACYQCIIAVFDELFMNIVPTFPTKTSEEVAERPALFESMEEAVAVRQQMLDVALTSKDMLFHVDLYNWFIQHDLSNDLIQNCLRLDVPFLEDYLKDNSLELLSKYYIHKKLFPAAALCLMKLAEKPGEEIRLEERVEHLAKAINCAQSSKGQGETLNTLQEMMDVAQVQLKVQKELDDLPVSRPITQEEQLARATAKHALDMELLTISDLYNKFAKRFGLWESCLAIMRVSGHNDPLLIQKFWKNIINEELLRAQNSEYPLESLRNKIVSVGRAHYPSEIVFPVGWLCDQLEQMTWELRPTRIGYCK
jgi:nuclear pore complex protein Nup155